MEEKRQFTRVDTDRIIYLESVNGETYEGKIKNICLRGSFVSVDTWFNESAGTEFTFSISLVNHSAESDSIINGTATLVRQTEEGIALYFKELSMEGFSNLRQLMELNTGDSKQVESELKSLYNKDSGNVAEE